MLIKNLPLHTVPAVKTTNTVGEALLIMQDRHVRHVAVVADGFFAGICNEDLLIDIDENAFLETISYQFIKISVNENVHFLQAVFLASNNNLTIVPVINDSQEYIGCIESFHLLENVATYMNLKQPAALIVLQVEGEQYSFTEISKIIETNDSQIVQLNTSSLNEEGFMEVSIFINKMEVSDIVATFQRYDYTILHYFGEEIYSNELKDNYENLMNYLNV